MVKTSEWMKRYNNDGFSLVELIVVVCVLAIAAIPLMKSMGMASRVNAKAQSIQNATSLGESVMEQMKSTPVAELPSLTDWTFEDKGSYYLLTRKGAKAFSVTQGEKFDVSVKIDKESYSGNVTPVAKKANNVKSANTIKLPVISEIDTMSQAVLSSQKELNRFDTEAVSYFNQKIKDYPAHKATVTSKVVDIVKNSLSEDYGVTVKATVTYMDDAKDKDGNPAPNKYVRDLYTGTFVKQDSDFDSNIYIFYTAGIISDGDGDNRNIWETININDTDDYSAFADAKIPNACHKIIFIRQDKNDCTGPTITFNKAPDEVDPNKEFKYSNVSSLGDEGCKNYGNIRLITNLDNTNITKEGHIYGEDSKTRVYDITIELYKTGESAPITSLHSTKTASDTPTPTPTPTP